MLTKKSSKIKLTLLLTLLVLAGFFIYRHFSLAQKQAEKNIVYILPPQLYTETTDNQDVKSFLNETGSAETLVWQAKTYLENNQPQEAVVALEKSVQADANYRDGFYLLGYAYLKKIEKEGQGKTEPFKKIDDDKIIVQLSVLEKAEIALNQAKSIDPISPKIYQLLAMVEELKGDKELAAKYNQQAEKLQAQS